MVGVCTWVISGAIGDVGNELLSPSTSRNKTGVAEPGIGIGTVAVWQNVNTRVHADGNGSPYLAMPKSWSVRIGGATGDELKLGSVEAHNAGHTGDALSAEISPDGIGCSSRNSGMSIPTVEYTFPLVINACAVTSQFVPSIVAELGPASLNSVAHADPFTFRSNEVSGVRSRAWLTVLDTPLTKVRAGKVASVPSRSALKVPSDSGSYCRRKAGADCE